MRHLLISLPISLFGFFLIHSKFFVSYEVPEVNKMLRNTEKINDVENQQRASKVFDLK